MRTVLSLLCCFLLLASLFGPANLEGSSHGTQADALHAVSLVPDSLCGVGSGHGSCQLAVIGHLLLLNLMASAGSPYFEITPVAAPSRSFAPHTPPPRRVL